MKKCLLFLSLFIQILSVSAQNCNNIGFENGTLTNWVLSYGALTDDNVRPLYGTEIIGSVESEHIITRTSSGNDPRVYTEAISQAAPGSDYSIRFGNTSHGGKYNRIKNTFVVSQFNTLLQYRFAVVLQDDGNRHTDIQKPGFAVRLLDASGNPISCSFYDIQLQRAGVIDGFKTQGDIDYRNWTTVAVDLRAYIGQTLTLEATVHGCTKMVHYGYAYFDAKCLKSEVKPQDGNGCPDADGYITLKAPEGFAKYTWSNGDTTANARVKAVLGETYTVKLLPYNSLNENCDIQIDYNLTHFVKEREFSKTICEGQGGYRFNGINYDATGIFLITKPNGTNCDSLITMNLYVSPISRINQDVNLCEGDKFTFRGKTYNSTGVYTQTVKSAEVCDSIFTFNVKVTPLTRISQSKRICAGEKFKVGDSTYTKTGTYITTIKRIAKCDSIVTTQLTVEKTFTLSSSPDVSIEKGDSVLLQALIQPPLNNYTYDWNPKEGLACGTCATTWAKPNTSTTYIVAAVVQNGICINKAKTFIGVSCGLYLPTIFTPNNDRINDLFKIEGSRCIKIIKEIVIYNRWGEVVFQDQNYSPFDSSHGWDGTYQGKLALQDVYAYKIIAELKNGEIYDTDGLVTLVR